MLLQSNWFEQERFNGLPSSGDHIKQPIGAGILPAELKSLLRGAHALQKLEAMQLFVACLVWVGVLFLLHAPEKDIACFWKVREKGI